MSAKQLLIEPVSVGEARRLVERYHYSGRAYPKSRLHLGVFWEGRLEGVMSFGPPLDPMKLIGLVDDTPWDGFCELNRMAFSPALPRNSESRALAIAFRLFRRYAPWIQWIVSFADARESGNGVIYRAAGFWLTGVRSGTTFWRTPSGERISRVGLNSSAALCKRLGIEGRGVEAWRRAGLVPQPGRMLRYLYPLRDDVRARLTVDILPYSAAVAKGDGRSPTAPGVRSDPAASTEDE